MSISELAFPTICGNLRLSACLLASNPLPMFERMLQLRLRASARRCRRLRCRVCGGMCHRIPCLCVHPCSLGGAGGAAAPEDAQNCAVAITPGQYFMKFRGPYLAAYATSSVGRRHLGRLERRWRCCPLPREDMAPIFMCWLRRALLRARVLRGACRSEPASQWISRARRRHDGDARGFHRIIRCQVSQWDVHIRGAVAGRGRRVVHRCAVLAPPCVCLCRSSCHRCRAACCVARAQPLMASARSSLVTSRCRRRRPRRASPRSWSAARTTA